jgi:hypothetical protein
MIAAYASYGGDFSVSMVSITAFCASAPFGKLV